MIPKTAMALILEQIKDNLLDGGSMILFQNDPILSSATVIGDLDVADFTGYAPVTLTTWHDPQKNVEGGMSLVSPQANFAASGTTVGNTCYGYAILDVNDALFLAAKFDQPVGFAGVGDAIQITCEYSYNPNS